MKRILTALLSLVAAPALVLGSASPASAATSGSTLVPAAYAAALDSCKGFDRKPLEPLERVEGGVNYGALLVCSRVQDDDFGFVFDAKAIVIPTKRATTDAHSVTIYADELYDDDPAATKTAIRRTGTLTWTFNDVPMGADMKFWAKQDVPGKSTDAKTWDKVLVDYLN